MKRKKEGRLVQSNILCVKDWLKKTVRNLCGIHRCCPFLFWIMIEWIVPYLANTLITTVTPIKPCYLQGKVGVVPRKMQTKNVIIYFFLTGDARFKNRRVPVKKQDKKLPLSVAITPILIPI